MDTIVGLFAIIIGSAILWFSIKFLGVYWKVKKWDRITATIVSKEIMIHEKYSTTRTPYKLNVNYNYSVGDKNYSGHFVYLAELMGGQANHMKKNAEIKLEKMKDIMLIYVDPKDPNKAVMYCDGALLYWFTLIMGLVAMLFGLMKFI